MSWLKKTFHKVSKHLKRASKGKFHLGHVGLSASKKFLPKKARRLLERANYGSVKRSLQKYMIGNNSAGVIYAGGDSGVGYQYNGKSISELM